MSKERQYPCIECGVLRTKSEGGTTFSVCDECWSKPKTATQVSMESRFLEASKFAEKKFAVLQKVVDTARKLVTVQGWPEESSANKLEEALKELDKLEGEA